MRIDLMITTRTSADAHTCHHIVTNMVSTTYATTLALWLTRGLRRYHGMLRGLDEVLLNPLKTQSLLYEQVIRRTPGMGLR